MTWDVDELLDHTHLNEGGQGIIEGLRKRWNLRKTNLKFQQGEGVSGDGDWLG